LVARAPADGYTLLSATPQVAIAQSMYKNTTFNPRRDLAPIALVGIIPNVLLVNPRTSATTVQELVELARRNPGKLNYSSTGAGTSVHLSAELLKYYAKVNIVHVPYRGSAAATAALIAGDVDMLVDSLPPSLRHIRSGRARALAGTPAPRWSKRRIHVSSALDAGRVGRPAGLGTELVSEPPDPHGGRLSAGKWGRPRAAARRRAPRRQVGSSAGGREPAGRLGAHRHRDRRQGAARRVHAPHRAAGVRDHAAPLRQAALRRRHRGAGPRGGVAGDGAHRGSG